MDEDQDHEMDEGGPSPSNSEDNPMIPSPPSLPLPVDFADVIPLLASSSMSSSSTTNETESGPTTNPALKRPGSNDDDVEGDQPGTKRSSIVLAAPPPPQGVGLSMEKIRQSIENTLGQTFPALAEMIIRNEPAFGTAVDALRLVLSRQKELLGESWKAFMTALGPMKVVLQPRAPAPEIPMRVTRGMAARALAASKAGQPPPPPSLTDKDAKAILFRLGRVLEVYSRVIRNIGYGDGLTISDLTSPATPGSYNKVVYMLGLGMGQIGDQLQYTFRQNVLQMQRVIHDAVIRIKEKIDTAVQSAKDHEAENFSLVAMLAAEGSEQPPFIQLQPPAIFGPTTEPHLRYRLTVPRDDFDMNVAPKLVPEHVSASTTSELQNGIAGEVSKTEGNIRVRHGSLEFMSGTKGQCISYKVQGVTLFHMRQIYASTGWVVVDSDSSSNALPGKYIRSLEFNMDNFVPGTAQHQIKAKPIQTSAATPLEGPSQQIEIVISGVSHSHGGRRVEYVFALPPHLAMMHVNDVGVINSVLKIQFCK